MGADVRHYFIVKLKGDDFVRDNLGSEGFQILKAIPRDDKIPHWTLYWVRQWGKSNRAIVIQLGAKIKLSHNDVYYDDPVDYFKGVTFQINPMKDIS